MKKIRFSTYGIGILALMLLLLMGASRSAANVNPLAINPDSDHGWQRGDEVPKHHPKVDEPITGNPVEVSLRALVAECVSHRGTYNALIVKLNVGKYQAFINQVRALSGKKIDIACADQMIQMATDLLNNPYPINVAPIASDDVYNAVSTMVLNILAPGVLSNDTDADSDPLTPTLVSGPTHAGYFEFMPDGAFVYQPSYSDFFSEDTFTYSVSDGHGGTDTATVTITIRQNHTPVTKVDDYNTPSYWVFNDETLTFPIYYSDPDGDPLTVYVAPGVLNDDNTVTYTPTLGYFGLDWVGYDVCDPYDACTSGSVTIEVLGYSQITVTKVVDWNRAAPNPNQTFEVCLYDLADVPLCHTFGYLGGTYTWERIKHGGVVFVEETDPGDEWGVVRNPYWSDCDMDTPVVCTFTFTNTYIGASDAAILGSVSAGDVVNDTETVDITTPNDQPIIEEFGITEQVTPTDFTEETPSIPEPKPETTEVPTGN